MYFHLYNFYYRDGNCKETDNPALRAAHVLTAGILFWILFVSFIYNFFILNIKKFMPKYVYLSFYLIFFIIIYYFYCKKQRYKFVYEQYKDLGRNKRMAGRFLVISLVLLPILLLALFTFSHFIIPR